VSAAHDVRRRSFSTSVVGYDRGEVEAFRDEVAGTIEELHERIGALERQVGDFESAKPITADQAFAQVARETQRILQVAQDAGARLLQQAREQAENELAVARREHAQIVGEGYRTRDKMGDQLGALDQARTRLLQKLHDAGSEIERVCAAVDSDPPGEARRVVSEQAMEHARTGTDLARRPIRPGEPTLRVVNGEDGSEQPALMRRVTRRHEPIPPGGGDPLVDKRDQLAPLRAALIDSLREELRLVRDRLREHLRQAADVNQRTAIVLDKAALAGAAAAGNAILARAFDLGARAAEADHHQGDTPAEQEGDTPPERGEHDDSALSEVLDARIGAPIRSLLEHARKAQDPPWVLSERVDGVISDASEAMVAEIAETELSRAFERGKLATWIEGSAARRWIVSPRGHRRDDRCRQNANAGAVPPDEPFPSGEDAPPRFSDCTCTTSAAEEDNDP
jgi:cell division initiation protein